MRSASTAGPTAGQRRFLTAEWRYLVMLNYEVDASLLVPRVPAGTELDTWDGRALASMVGFRFLDTRVMGAPIAWHRDFDEVNLRFYVRRKDPVDGWRRGVVFVREIVPRAAIAVVARLLYNEPYIALPMRHELRMETLERGEPGLAAYEWRHRGRWNRLSVRTEGSASPIADGSEEEFITEHYWGYTAQRGGGTKEYRVEHPRWNVWRTIEASLDCDVTALYGAGFAERLGGPPRSAFVADGSPVVVYRGSRVA